MATSKRSAPHAATSCLRREGLHAASAFASPAIIGGRRLKVAATLAYDEFLNTLNWPLGAAVATLLLVALVLITVGSNRLVERRYAQVFE